VAAERERQGRRGLGAEAGALAEDRAVAVMFNAGAARRFTVTAQADGRGR
jgi:hypothetical protein